MNKQSSILHIKNWALETIFPVVAKLESGLQTAWLEILGGCEWLYYYY